MITDAPEHCSIAVIQGFRNLPNSTGPTFTTAFRNPAKPIQEADFHNYEGATIDITCDRLQNSGIVRFRAFEHFCRECGYPNALEASYTTTAFTATSFRGSVEESTHFCWILSAPDFEARAVIERESGLITAKEVVYRVIH